MGTHAGNGTPEHGEREYSLKQLINRVVNAIGDYGMEHGYFDHQKSRWAYTDDLRYLLVHQMAAFNSPVWFNCGLGSYGLTSDSRVWAVDLEKRADGGTNEPAHNHRTVPVAKSVDPLKRPQSAACYILSLDDTLDDIMRVMDESARLFKYGSGVGSDWSKLRSGLDKLSGGGTPSGPVSFMTVQDSVAGTIRSGGRACLPGDKLSVRRPDCP